MRKSRFSEEQIIGVLREQEAGARTMRSFAGTGSAREPFYKWKARYGGLEVSEARRLKAVEDENRVSSSYLKRISTWASFTTCNPIRIAISSEEAQYFPSRWPGVQTQRPPS